MQPTCIVITYRNNRLRILRYVMGKKERIESMTDIKLAAGRLGFARVPETCTVNASGICDKKWLISYPQLPLLQVHLPPLPRSLTS